MAHFERGNRDAARIGGFGGHEQNARVLEHVDRLGSRRHIRAFADREDFVLDERFGVVCVKLVLRGAGEGNVAFYLPYSAAFVELRALDALGVFFDPASLYFLDVAHDIEVYSVFIVDPTVGIGHGDDLCAEALRFLRRIDSNVARAGDCDGFAV